MKTRTKETLTQYCQMFGINEQEAIEKTQQAIRHYKGSEVSDWIIAAKNEWYGHLRTEGEARYSLYDSQWYFCELLACYDVYSSGYIDLISGLKIQAESVLDLGCGLGITSRHLAEALGVSVFGTNIEATRQFEFCKKNINVFGGHALAGKVDMVFASEYFEHIYNAGDHLIEIIDANNPSVIVMANAFRAESLGHFDYFYNSGWASKSFPCDSMISSQKMGRLFSEILKGAGFSKVETGFWNSRPNVWKK